MFIDQLHCEIPVMVAKSLKMPGEQAQQQPSARKLSGPCLNAFFAICDRWQLTLEESCSLMGEPPRQEFVRWSADRHNTILNELQIKRISYLLAIYNALKEYLPKRTSSLAWIRRPNDHSLFQGKSPLEFMRQGKVEHLNQVLLLIA